MERFTPEMKVAHVVQSCPETAEVFASYGCPDMRRGFFRVMASIMSVRNAARIHRLPLEKLVRDLNRAGTPSATQ